MDGKTINHSEREHSILPPSGAHRWMHCTPSAQLIEQLPVKDEGSVFASEGTLAHEMAEHALHLFLIGEWDIYEPVPVLPEHIENTLYSPDMKDYVLNYCTFCIDQYFELSPPTARSKMLLEQRFDISAYVPECSGSCDCTIIGSETLAIIDLKYGKGVKVEAEHNEQLMLYALGALLSLPAKEQKRIKDVVMYIAQVRLNHYPQFKMRKEDLLEWAENELKPKALTAWKGEGVAKSGEWCVFCPLKPKCKAHVEAMLTDFESYPEPLLLSDEEISALIPRMSKYAEWVSSFNKFVYAEALRGKKWDGYKLIAGRSSRVITDKDYIRNELIKEYLLDEVLKIEMRGITDLEKLVGKKKFNTLYSPYIETKPGQPKLVPDSDPHEEYSSLDDFEVESDFSDGD